MEIIRRYYYQIVGRCCKFRANFNFIGTRRLRRTKRVLVDLVALTQTLAEDDNSVVNIRRTPPLNIKTTTSPKQPIKEEDEQGFADPGKAKQDEVKKITGWEEISSVQEGECCPICLCDFDSDEDSIVKLSKCTAHYFHPDCIVHCYKSGFLQCPICNTLYGIRVGNMPNGTMNVKIHPIGTLTCSGNSDCGTIEINYSFPSGTQGANHPHPGVPYTGTSRTAYLPDNTQGKEVLALLKIGWERKLLFQVGRSVTTGEDNQVVWGGVHHKTTTSGGPTSFGYPDATYFDRVKQELSSKGVYL
eukprot:TRINITY_DN8542_c0_g1_i2.p1 TRINITY_DN8542_c0_g1~~TRINITY_DN8542_c0_g1_i2.p1  ORF type:complete len:302 (-),score=43.80 TRINITY_DN8542_c0_g1_i2:97-1002(-)